MAEVSRTARVIQNAKVALFFYCINLILQFFSRKIFLDYLGAELLGLNTTAQNLLQFLNLAESGIGAAVAFALYKPLSQKNRQEIIDIVSLQGWFYRWVGLFVIVGSIVLMAFFPWIFAKAQISLIYAYVTFTIFLISTLLGYFVNYKMIVLSADQKEYKVTTVTQGVKVAKIFVQMIAVLNLDNAYIWWMFIEFLAAIVTSIFLTYYIKKEYPWLRSASFSGKYLKNKYPYILTKTKQLFFHKIGGYVLGQTTPLVVYAFTTLTTVAIYGNYVLVMGGCLMLVEALFKGVTASVGNLVVSGNSKQIREIFWKIVTIKLIFAGAICCGIAVLSNSFITLWIGSNYVMPIESMLVMVAIYFIQMTRTSEIFLSAYGLFQDIFAPLLESILNLVLSILFGYYWGLTGILVGILLSQIIVVNSWKVYFLYSKGFRTSIIEYVIGYTKKLLLLCLAFLSVYCVFECIFNVEAHDFYEWCLLGLFVIAFYFCVSAILFYLFDSVFKLLIKQLINVIKLKLAQYGSFSD